MRQFITLVTALVVVVIAGVLIWAAPDHLPHRKKYPGTLTVMLQQRRHFLDQLNSFDKEVQDRHIEGTATVFNTLPGSYVVRCDGDLELDIQLKCQTRVFLQHITPGTRISFAGRIVPPHKHDAYTYILEDVRDLWIHSFTEDN